MAVINVALVFIGAITYFTSYSSAVKTHDVWVSKADKPEMDQDFVENFESKLKKINKKAKEVNINFDLKQDVGSDVMCEAKIFQKSNGNYVKTPVDVPKTSCCEFIEENKLIWPCVKKQSNFPEKCPISKGAYWVKDYNVDQCNYTENLPPKLPEEYKMELHISKGAKQIFKQSFYGNLKRIMNFL